MWPKGAGPGQAKFFGDWISSRLASRSVSPPKENKLKSSRGGHLLGSFHLEEGRGQLLPGKKLGELGVVPVTPLCLQTLSWGLCLGCSWATAAGQVFGTCPGPSALRPRPLLNALLLIP